MCRRSTGSFSKSTETCHDVALSNSPGLIVLIPVSTTASYLSYSTRQLQVLNCSCTASCSLPKTCRSLKCLSAVSPQFHKKIHKQIRVCKLSRHNSAIGYFSNLCQAVWPFIRSIHSLVVCSICTAFITGSTRSFFYFIPFVYFFLFIVLCVFLYFIIAALCVLINEWMNE